MYNAPTKLGSSAAGYRVWLSRLNVAGIDGAVTPAVYDDFEDTGAFIAQQVVEQLAPGVHRAKVQLNLAQLNCWPWDWKTYFAYDDRIRIVSDHVEPKDRHVAFEGFVVDVDWGFSDKDGHVFITAVGPAWRLLRDAAAIAHGQVHWKPGRSVGDGLGAGPPTIQCTALPLRFNAGGMPNRHKTRDISVTNAWRGGLGVFTGVEAWENQWWTASDAIDFILRTYNTDETWIANPAAPGDGDLNENVVVDVEGMDAWTAVAAIADRAGYDVCEQCTNDQQGGASYQIRVVRRGGGTQRTVKHQIPDTDGLLPAFDLAKTNAFQLSIAESVASCVATPTIAGGRTINEISVILWPAWDPALLTLAAPSYICPPGCEDRDPNNLYVQRYCLGAGPNILSNTLDVGRLWDANTDGRYSGPPYNQPTGQTQLELEDWPLMPLAARDALTAMEDHPFGGCMESIRLEIFCAGWNAWQEILEGWELVPGRLAVRLTPVNLASIQRNDFVGFDPTSNLFAYLLAGNHASIRLTCSVAAPQRNIVTPKRRSTSGTSFDQGAWYDRGEGGQIRKVHYSSRYRGTGHADEVDGTNWLKAIAGNLQEAMEDRTIEADIPVEWPDDEPALTDVITRIEGIEYDLAINAGGARRFPRVIARTLLLTPETYAMHVTVGTDRKLRAR